MHYLADDFIQIYVQLNLDTYSIIVFQEQVEVRASFSNLQVSPMQTFGIEPSTFRLGAKGHPEECVFGGWFKQPHLARYSLICLWGWVVRLHTCGALANPCLKVKPAVTTHTQL